MADPTYEELSAENTRLRQKNAELLDELKKARGRLKDLEAAQPEGLSELESLRAEVLDLKLHKPVAAMLEGVLVSPKYSAQELGEHYKFELNDAGEIELRDLEGNPVTVDEKVDGKETTRPVRFEEQDIWRYLVNTGNFNHIIRGSRATGGGARPSSQPHSWSTTEQPAPKAAPSKPGFGLK